jgi:hypothetical protein
VHGERVSACVDAALGIAWTAVAAGSASSPLAFYRSDEWHFTIAVPADMKVDESERRQEEELIQFSDDSGRWFTVVAAPYTELDVASGEEFLPNSASDQSTTLGVVKVHRDNTCTASFVRNGIAYSVVTNVDGADWLLPILQSWAFTN